MQRLLLLTVALLSLVCGIRQGWAQSTGIAAGQTTGMVVTTLNPVAHVLAAPIPAHPLGTTATQLTKDSLDLNADGRFDIGLKCYQLEHSPAGPPPINYGLYKRFADLVPLHSDVQILSGGPGVSAFAAGDSMRVCSWCCWTACTTCNWATLGGDDVMACTATNFTMDIAAFGVSGMMPSTATPVCACVSMDSGATAGYQCRLVYPLL